jgi:hypothetical protein
MVFLHVLHDAAFVSGDCGQLASVATAASCKSRVVPEGFYATPHIF